MTRIERLTIQNELANLQKRINHIEQIEKKQEPEKVDWMFGMICSYRGSGSAVFDRRYE
jgi:hypothetical protein